MQWPLGPWWMTGGSLRGEGSRRCRGSTRPPTRATSSCRQRGGRPGRMVADSRGQVSTHSKPRSCWRSGGGNVLGCTLSIGRCPVILVPNLVPQEYPLAITASEARKNLFPLIERVNADRAPIEITSRKGDAVLMSKADYDALEETAHLLRVPANARHLLESLHQAQSGQRASHDLVR